MLTAKLGPVKIDYAGMKRKADRATDRATVKQLAFIRRRARTRVLRRRKRVSRPGSAPSVHSKDSMVTLKNIRFEYQGSGVGVVGPVKLNQVNITVEKGNQPIPSILEHGGVIRLREQRPKNGFGRWRRVDGRSRKRKPDLEYRVRKVKIKPRPFMETALEAEIEAGTIMTPYANVLGD